MKLSNIFTALIASLALMFVGCQEEERFLDEVKVSQSYVAIPAEGGQVEITVNALDNWEITGIPEWLTVSPATGAAGETKVTFSAGEATATNEALLYLNCAGASQVINVLQLTEKVELPISTCADVIAGEDGVVYRVKGTVTSIANTTYGNWYLEDETGSVYIYGTLYEGAEKQFDKIGLEVGDIVTVEGPRKDYSGTIELVNVTVIDIEKSLIKVDEVSPEDALLPIEGGEFTVSLTCKGEGVSVVIPEDAKSWLTLSGVSLSGTTAVVTFVAAVNELGDRSAELVFVTKKDGVEYKAVASLSQTGSIIEATAAEINAAEDGETQYRLTGYISGDKESEYGNIYIKDATGEVYVYGVLDSEGQSKQWFNMGINKGDIVTVVGPKTSYNGSPQMKNVSIENHVAVTDKTIAEFLAAEESKEVYYRLTGVVSGLESAGDYGNVYLTDESGESVYVYGILSGWGGAKKEFQTLVANTGLVEGDILTIVGVRTSYNGTPQVGSAFYVSHESGEAPYVPTPGEGGVVENGKYYIVAGDKAASALAEDKSYGYLPAVDAATAGETEQFAFQYYPDFGGYTVQDTYGRYVYNSMKDEVNPWPSVNVSESLPKTEEEFGFYIWVIDTEFGDNEWEIFNCATLFGITYSSSNDRWEVADAWVDDFANEMPVLVSATETPGEGGEEGGNDDAETTSTDVLTFEAIGLAGTSTQGYQDWTYTAASGAVYAGQSNGGYEDVAYIQLRSKNNNSGVVTTASAGKVAKVVLTWNSMTSAGRKVLVYGNSTAYAAPTDLYDEAKQGTKVGELEYASEAVTELVVSEDCVYIGLRSDYGALYLDKIEIVWAE